MEIKDLNQDDNEALELEIVFYNYYDVEDNDLKGRSFIPTNCTITQWYANYENAYLDTNFMDGEYEESYCVGIDDTRVLEPNKAYRWGMNFDDIITEQLYPNDGRYKIQAQRGYRAFPFDGAYSVFAEEHEHILSLGLENDERWIPESVFETPAAAIWNAIWNFDSSIHPVKMAGQ